jgi:hypothetical protein
MYNTIKNMQCISNCKNSATKIKGSPMLLSSTGRFTRNTSSTTNAATTNAATTNAATTNTTASSLGFTGYWHGVI